MTLTPTPQPGVDAAVAWVERHLEGLFRDDAASSPAIRGGQVHADAAMASFDVAGYAARRNEVWPPQRRGASRLSPYIRHGLLPLPRVWDAVADGPRRDVAKFRDELLWQEYARHVYARLGGATRTGFRFALAGSDGGPWRRDMACIDLAVGELERDGWLVNQTRMWLASQWSVREGGDWRDGEAEFFAHLLDGSRAANRLGWQWTVGTGTGRPYGFSRYQVEKRAPGVCASCPLVDACPIEDWPDDPDLIPVEPHPLLISDPDPEATGGPSVDERSGVPARVWLTAESLGDADPALAAHPDLPAIFVFDRALLHRLQLTSKRLVFLVETLADLAVRRDVEIHVGDPVAVLGDHLVAVTFAPVPGFRRRASRLHVAAVHPWPWLRRPHGRSVRSFSAWRKHIA